MTNKEDEENPPCDPCVATLLAVHLVGQVLDEAYIIVNAAQHSGRPWRYVSSLKKLRSCRLKELYDKDMTFTVSNASIEYRTDNNIENRSSAVVTSTPQKEESPDKPTDESTFIGQGDTEFEVVNDENSTSMFITHLFNMSDVAHIITCDEGDVILTNDTDYYDKELLMEDMGKIMDSYVDTALSIVFEQEGQGYDVQTNILELSDITDNTSYSYLSDAFDIPKDINDSINIRDGNEYEKTINRNITESTSEKKEKFKNDAAFYENAYLTLNRDYEQYSEEEEPILQDPNTTPMHEVNLLNENKSAEDIDTRQEKTELNVSGISTSVAISQKSSLVRRCRTQGARLLSCLKRWWWRRKLLGKRKVSRAPGSIRGLCPLSPDARRRAASLLDNRNLRTPSPSKSMVWKFNTVNEALVHSTRWKEFGLKMSLTENDEF